MPADVLHSRARDAGSPEPAPPCRRLAPVPTLRRSRAPVLAFATALAALLAACAPAAPQLEGESYLSVGVTEGGVAKSLAPGTRIEIRFEGGSLHASAGCNSMSGPYRIDGGRLRPDGGMGITAMGCDRLLALQDEWLMAFLQSEPAIRLVNTELTLEGGSTVVRLLDREVAEPDLNLVGPTWTVESIITGDAVSSVPAGATATFVFMADGSLELSPGCNRGGGTWRLQGAGLEVTGIALTKMACQGPEGELEAAVLQVLSAGTLGATIESNLLTLQGAGGGLQLRGG